VNADDPIDFRSLDAERYPGTEGRVVGAAMARIRARRSGAASAARLVPAWWNELVATVAGRPRLVLVSAAMLMVASTVVAEMMPRAHRMEAPATVTEALGIPPVLARWIRGQPPSNAELWSLSAESR
jgi:hypothetical protein